MNEIKHAHIDDLIIDKDAFFTIDPVTRAISNGSNKKLTIMQYDHKSERYSFEMDKEIDGHDLTNCNRVQIHFINIGSNRQRNPGIYPVTDVQVKESDNNKITFSWLIGSESTQFSGILSFLISFECVEGEQILYRWSTLTYNAIQITAGMDNNELIMEIYSDELLAWQNNMETVYIPTIVDERYIEREFATSAEVGAIFGITTPIEGSSTGIDEFPTANSVNPVQSGGVKTYVDDAVATKLDSTQGVDNANKTMITDENGNVTPSDKVIVGGITIQKGLTEDGEVCLDFVFPEEGE